VSSTHLLTPTEVCQQLSISRKTLQRLTDASAIRFERIGHQLRFTPEGLAEYRQRNTRRTRPVFAGPARSRVTKLANHNRWHVKRGVVSPTCALCSAVKS
jgi:excisionase family DNA binding protein